MDTALGGTDGQWGIQHAKARIAALEPDFVILGFGNNDRCTVEQYLDNIRTIIRLVRVDQNGYVWETVFDVVSLGFSVYDVVSNPDDVGAWLGLLGDVIDLVPFVTGAGETVRAVRIAQLVSDSFGTLSKAQKYGIMSYNSLRKKLRKTGLEAHHIIESRLVKHLNIDINKMLSVAVTKSEHQVFTNAWRKHFKYGMDYSKLTRNDIWNVAQKVYKKYPALLSAAKKILFG